MKTSFRLPTARRAEIDPFLVMDVIAAATRAEAEGRHIVHMEVGQPATAAPEGARRAVARAMAEGPMGYTVSLGRDSLRARIAGHYADVHGIEVDPARIVVTAGASGAFVLAFSLLFDAGDRVALGSPGYPSYRQILRALDLAPVDIQTAAEDRYQPTPEGLPEGLAGLILASPTNPAGTMLDRAALSALIERAAEIGAAVVSDEIYHGLEYERPSVTALSVTDEVCVVNSFSKYFSMTGWRVGWMVLPERLVRPAERLMQNLFICAPHVAQIAAEAAFDCLPELEANRAVYAENRRLMLEGLPRAGFSRIAPPDGAFYVYADVSEMTGDSLAFAARILDEAGVAVTPGVDFDPVRGRRFLRFSYAGSTAEIREGLERLAAFTASL